MKASTIIGLVVLIATSLATVLPTSAGELFHRRGASGPQWNTNYYDAAWGMPMSVVVPPTARWQANYARGVGGSRWDRAGAQYGVQYSGPESAYNQRDYQPAPPQPSDTTQMGANYVRGPRP